MATISKDISSELVNYGLEGASNREESIKTALMVIQSLSLTTPPQPGGSPGDDNGAPTSLCAAVNYSGGICPQ